MGHESVVEKVKWQAIGLWKAGKSYRDIGSALRISKTCVEHLVQKFKASGTVTTKHNKAKLARKLWFYRLLMVSLLCGSQGETVSKRKHREQALGHSPRLLEETPFF